MTQNIDGDQKEIVFMWVSGQFGLSQNETGDRAAEEALNKQPIDDLTPF